MTAIRTITEFYDRDGNSLPGAYGATYMYRRTKTNEEGKCQSWQHVWTRLPVRAAKG